MNKLKTIFICELGLIKVMAIKGCNIIDTGRECIELANILKVAIDLYWNSTVIRIYESTDIDEIIKNSTL